MPPIALLTHTNHSTWKVRMEAHRRSEGLWDVVSPSPSPTRREIAAQRARSLPIPLPVPKELRIKLLSDRRDFRMWRKQVGFVLRSEGLWGVVSPAPPVGEAGEEFADVVVVGGGAVAEGSEAAGDVAAPLPAGRVGESMFSSSASVIIFEYCDDHSLDHIIHLPDAASRWERLRKIYGPNEYHLDGLLRDFHCLAPPPGTSISAIADRLEGIAEDIEEISPKLKKSDSSMVLALVGAVGRAVARAGPGTRGEGVWDGARIRIFIKEGKCTYDEALEDLLACERIVGPPGGGRGGGRGGGGKGRRRGRGKR